MIVLHKKVVTIFNLGSQFKLQTLNVIARQFKFENFKQLIHVRKFRWWFPRYILSWLQNVSPIIFLRRTMLLWSLDFGIAFDMYLSLLICIHLTPSSPSYNITKFCYSPKLLPQECPTYALCLSHFLQIANCRWYNMLSCWAQWSRVNMFSPNSLKVCLNIPKAFSTTKLPFLCL